MSMFKPEFIPRILLSLILFGLGSALLIFGNPGCLCPLELVGQPHPPPTIYPILQIVIVVLLISAGVFVLLIPSGRPIRQTGDAGSADSSSDSKL
ncbi:MAG: hypothetical protein AUF79_10735 [Crenarchaeota archaeon 13_1_20CM_2_51_8]|nr:MAG: hypothetical protein AUF79_10735 [Crenarchaeota archaeon 13_1_20CM_2_51_8]